MPLDPRLSDEDRANLVAYLDGELDQRSAQALEAKLNLHPGNREEAEALRRTWQLLDYLPRPEASPVFTSQTLDRIAVLPARTFRLGVGAWQPWALGIGWALVLVVAALGGFAGGKVWPHRLTHDEHSRTDLDEPSAQDLRVIQNQHFYAAVEDLPFLRSLASTDDPDLFGAAEGAPSDPGLNKQTLFDRPQQISGDVARLRRDVQTFRLLPPERQDQLRRFDHDLRELDSATATKLARVLGNYVDWLDQLPAADRHQVQEASKPGERLERIKSIREKQWIERLPKAYRDQLQAAKAESRVALIRQYRRDAVQRGQEWQLAREHWQDLLKVPALVHLEDYHPAVQAFVKGHLLPLLDQAEKKSLQEAEGQWPLYPQVLVALADLHPLALPGPATGPCCWDELPLDVQKALETVRPIQRLTNLKTRPGGWPDYAIKVTEFAHRNLISLPRQLGPSKPAEFSVLIRHFISTQLTGVIDDSERKEVKNTLNRWPQFPQTLLQLARNHHLEVPEMGLPGPREYWDRFRIQSRLLTSARPDLNDAVLQDFAQKELTPQERQDLRLSPVDAASRERLQLEYLRRHPPELPAPKAGDKGANR
jgi:hypothetical protein